MLQINCVYKYGSTGKIIQDIHTSLLEKGFESRVIYGRIKRTNEKPDRIKGEYIYKNSTEIEGVLHSILSKMFGVDFGFSYFATRKAIKIIKKEKPDVVQLHCLNGHFVNVYRLVDYLKKNKIKTAVTLHCEHMHTAGCDHAYECEKWKTECHSCPRIRGKISHYFRDDAKHCYNLMKDAFDGFKEATVVGVSKWISDRSSMSPIFKDAQFTYIHNGIDTNVFYRRDTAELRKKLGIPEGKKIVLNVTSNFHSPIKGGKYFLELVEKLPDYCFIIVGNNENTSLPENVISISHTNNQAELAEYYSMADCFVTTSLRETLPTVCLEAAACGCNVVGFNVSGVPETIPEGMGEAVTPFNIDEMVEAVKKWSNIKVSNELIAQVNYQNSRERMTENYIELFEKM